MKSGTTVFYIAFLLALVVPVIGASQAELLAQGIAGLNDKDPVQQAQGVSILQGIRAAAPQSGEAGDAAFALARYYKGERAKKLALYAQAWNTPSTHRREAGKSLGCIRSAVGDKQGAVDIWLAVAAAYPSEKESSYASAQRALVGMARLEKDWAKREVIRGQAKLLQDSILANRESPYYWENRIERAAMDHEEAQNEKRPWGPVIDELAEIGSDTSAPKWARARAYLIAAEGEGFQKNREGIIEFCDLALEVAKPDEAKPVLSNCRTEYYRSLYEKAGAFCALNRRAEAIPLYQQIIAECKPTDNFGGLDNVEAASWWLVKCYNNLGMAEEADEALAQFRQQYPNSRFLAEGK